jgi:hypothetical protein
VLSNANLCLVMEGEYFDFVILFLFSFGRTVVGRSIVPSFLLVMLEW